MCVAFNLNATAIDDGRVSPKLGRTKRTQNVCVFLSGKELCGLSVCVCVFEFAHNKNHRRQVHAEISQNNTHTHSR